MTTLANITVEGVDNRGDATAPFGYVYFSDGNRVLFGDTVNGVGKYGLNSSNWGEVPRDPYYTIAEKAIDELLGGERKSVSIVPLRDGDDHDVDAVGDEDKCADCGEYLDDHCAECGECKCPEMHCEDCGKLYCDGECADDE